MRLLFPQSFVCVLLLSTASPDSIAIAVPTEITRNDWYFRESLLAIRDWEQILAAGHTAGVAGTPRLPVPDNGQAVPWPNPIPSRLIPRKDRNQVLHVRLSAGQFRVQRAGSDGSTTSETLPGGADVSAYKHPGGGGGDQWYHQYLRDFDCLTCFHPQPAPFALCLNVPVDLRRGMNELSLTLRNVSVQPLTLELQLDFHDLEGSRLCDRRSIALAVDAGQPVVFPIELSKPGGGLLILTVAGSGKSYRLPLLTYVEDVAAILDSIDQILADTPDLEAAHQLASLRRRADAWPSGGRESGLGWSALFEEANQLRDQLLLGRIHFPSLLLVKRKPFISEQPFMDAHHLLNRPGGGIYRLTPPCPDGQLTPVVDSLGEGVYRDICLSWDAQQLVFAFGNGSDSWDGGQSYHVYQANADGTGLRQITTGPKNDCEPFYLPDGRIGFTSDRSEHFVMCGADRHAPNLFVMNAAGSDIRQLSFNMYNDFTPSVMSDGRILFGRWEYNERSVTAAHKPFTVHPDGTMVAPYYGNATIRPNVVMFARQVPDSTKVMALFTAHHGQTHGAVGLIDVRRGIDGDAPLTLLTPKVPVTGQAAEDSRWGWFSDPMPLSETTWLCSYTPTAMAWLESTWAIYLADRHGNLALVYRDPDISCAEPVPWAPRPHPHVLPSPRPDSDALDAEATVVLADVYAGLPEVPRGTAKYLRVLEDVPRKSVPQGGVICTSGTPMYTVKRILGTVPVEEDGSAQFVVPANRNVYFQVLDAAQREVQRMRSVVCLKPGEVRSCIGCHEPRNTTPACNGDRPVRHALTRKPSRPQPPPWGTEIISFLRDVQPVLNAKCIACHTHDRKANRVILTDDLTDQFTIGYEELLRYLSVADSSSWDRPEDVYPRPAYTFGSNASRLTKLLASGHYGVQLTDDEWQRLINWIDANGVYYDRYEMNWPDRRIFGQGVRATFYEICSRRCDSCHAGGGLDFGRVSLNWRDVRLSRALAAPLAQSAGGWGCCESTVFADTSDPDYQALLNAFTKLREMLREKPREDLLSIRGTAAEGQLVQLPRHPRHARGRQMFGWAALAATVLGVIGIAGRHWALSLRRWGRQRRRATAKTDNPQGHLMPRMIAAFSNLRMRARQRLASGFERRRSE